MTESSDVLERLRELNAESRSLLRSIVQLNDAFNSCLDLVSAMNNVAGRIRRASILYNEILGSELECSSERTGPDETHPVK